MVYSTLISPGQECSGPHSCDGPLDAGRITRADVVHGIALSDELTAKVVPLVSDGVVFA